jgi:UDP-N-acetylglucosamine 2-epimerase (non-hydrolysing)
MKNILIVFGTRPEAIKMAPLVHKLREYSNDFRVTVCVTAQHRQMLDQVLSFFEIQPDIDLNLMRPGQDLTDLTSSILSSMKTIFSQSMQDIVLVHGDTTTCMATSIAAFNAGIKVGHIEAGLRSGNILKPFPEEFNRQVTSKIASWHFAPTVDSSRNLENEGVNSSNILVTGNTVIDSLFWVLRRLKNEPDRVELIKTALSCHLPFDFNNIPFILITGHRRENFGSGFIEICHSLMELSSKYPFMHYVYPVHLNPNVQGPVCNLLKGFSNIHLIPPLDYEPFIFILEKCYLVLTDSGGIQEEAPSLGKPVLVMRDVTERPEAVFAGTVQLVGTNRNKIIDKVSELIEDKNCYEQMSVAHNPYGDGLACNRIVDFLRDI